MRLEQIRKAWDEFFFKPQSPLPYACFRILYGFLILQLLCIQLLPDMFFWYGKDGMFDHTDALKHFWHQPVFDMLLVTGDSHTGVTVFFIIAIVSALFVTIGLGTRYSAWVLFMCMVTMHYHDPMNINGGDAFLRIACLFLALSHAGEELSVDKWLKKKYAPDQIKEEYWPWAQRLFQIQVAIVYWQTSVAKLSGHQWIDGSAVWFATRLDDMFRFNIPYLFDSPLMCQWLSWGTLVIEVSLWSLIWVKELRYWVLLAGLLLHLGIDYSISLPLFEWAFISSFFVFVYPDDLKKFFLAAKVFSIQRFRRSAAAAGAVESSI